MVSNDKPGSTPDSFEILPPLPMRMSSSSATTPLMSEFRTASALSNSPYMVLPGSYGSGSSIADIANFKLNAGTTRLSAQHERLILELLPFKDAAQFREWLDFLEGDWEEYCRDYLYPQYRAALDDEAGNALESQSPDKAPADPEPDKAATAQRAYDAICKQSVVFLTFHPAKSDWTPEDHAVRFVATAIADSLLRKVWSERDWRNRPLDIAKAVYEVLSYKRAVHVDYQQRLWLARQQQKQQQARCQTQQQDRHPQPHPARHSRAGDMMDNPPNYQV
ncbi:hypothetical protein SEPCBS57363_000235 [Sporothrix epigloea]|uniref:Uncharacterized protein n=1 Tax=Sporothrix epigloea TaxID=1892477 RepID=A0ABP0D571_9PEZI